VSLPPLVAVDAFVKCHHKNFAREMQSLRKQPSHRPTCHHILSSHFNEYIPS